MKPDLRTVLNREIIVGDGAMGTFLYQLGFPVNTSFEELNITSPDVISDVHGQYLSAGARLLETNTFSANDYKLARFGLESKVEEINRAGVRIARDAAGPEHYVVGAVGSICGESGLTYQSWSWQETMNSKLMPFSPKESTVFCAKRFIRWMKYA